MKFFPDPSPRYFAPASYKQLQADGSLRDFDFDCEFKRLKRTELEALDEQVKAWRKKKLDVDAQLLAHVCTQWRVKPPKADGSPGEEVKLIPFAAEAAQLLEEEHPGFIAACVRSFYLSTAPVNAAHLAEKNS